MIYEFIKKNYSNGDPIFIKDIKGYSSDYVRQEMKRLTDEGKLKRFYNGVYYISYTTVLGTEGKISIDKFIERKYLYDGKKVFGYYSGIKLANLYGFTTQNPAYVEITSNTATTKQRKHIVDGKKFIIYKPPVEVTNKNISSLMFLDLLTIIDEYSEISESEIKQKIKRFININKVDFDDVKKYLKYYPDKTYKNLFMKGYMNELV